MNTVTTISAAVLEVLARDQMQQENDVGQERLKYFLQLAVTTAEKDFRDAIRDWKKQHDGDKVVGVRCSEFSTLYYATLHNANLDGKGYKAAVSHGRDFLAKLGLRGNGSPILSPEEKEANRNKTLLRKAMAEASKVVDFGQPDAMEKLAAQRDIELARIKEEAAQSALEKKIVKVKDLVTSIMADGDEYAMEVFRLLGDALGYKIELPEAEQIAA